MKYLNIVENFGNYLRNKTDLMETSILTYVKIIKELTGRYGLDPSVKQLNEFIEEKCKKRTFAVKYAIKNYLRFRWRPNTWKRVYKELVDVKTKKSLKKRIILKKILAVNIINSINNEKHRLIANLQYFTGAKANEIMSIKKEDVHKEGEFNRIRIDINSKKGKDAIYIDDSFWFEFQKYQNENGEYLFIRNTEGISDVEIIKKVSSFLIQYRHSLKIAGNNFDVNISSEDLRVSFSREIFKQNKDIIEVQKALRHKMLGSTIRYFDDEKEKIARAMLRHQQREQH